MASSKPSYPQPVANYADFVFSEGRSERAVSPISITRNGLPYRLEHVRQTGEVVLVAAQVPDDPAELIRMLDAQPVPAMAVGKTPASYDMERWFPYQTTSTERAVDYADVMRYFVTFNQARETGGRFNSDARIHPNAIKTAQDMESVLPVREIGRSLQTPVNPGVEWRLLTNDKGLIWAQTVAGGHKAAVKIMETTGPTGLELDMTIAAIDSWKGEPDGLQWVQSQTATWRNAHNPQTGMMVMPSGTAVQLEADVFGEGLTDVGPRFVLSDSYSTQFRYGNADNRLYAFSANARSFDTNAVAVAIVSPDRAAVINTMTFEQAQPGVEQMLNEGLRAQIGMPPLLGTERPTGMAPVLG